MKTSIKLLITLLLSSMATAGWAQATKTDSIRSAVLAIVNEYPKATLLDIYKSAFQDQYGPGHIISNVEGAEGYLRRELAEPFDGSYALYESTLYQGNYVRVSLLVIRDGVVPFDKYFDAFVRSVNQVKQPPIEKWKGDWEEILSVVESMNLNLADYERDKQSIAENLSQGKFQGDHSEVYVKTYDPHYRIFSREIFEKEIKPLIDDNYYPCGQLKL